MPSSKRSRPSAAGAVYEQLRELILSNAIAPDTRLNIDRLARELGVSQTPVREALQRLEGDRLVIAKQPRGYWTTSLLDTHGLAQLFEMRLLTEPWAAGVAAADRASNPGAWLLEEVEGLEEERDDDSRRDWLVRHDTRFHDAIFRAVGNHVVHEAFTRTHAHLHLFRLYSTDMDATVTLAEHARVAQAIKRCNPELAAREMRAHLLSAMRRFSRGLAEGSTDSQLELVRSSVLGGEGELTS